MQTTIAVVFVVVYLGMILGELPGLAIDRTGVALLGAIALLVSECVTPRQAWDAVDVPTIGLLFGLMVISAQFRLGGFYAALARRIAQARLSPPALLALLTASVGLLSAVLGNDIICLAMTPCLIEGCAGRRLNPVPFLLALAAASNVGSAATLIGNPQNVLIGESLKLSFGAYLLDAAVPAILGLGAVWWVIARATRGAWHVEQPAPPVHAPPLNVYQTAKGGLVLVLLVGAFLLTSWPRDLLALLAAGVVLLSRRMHSREMLSQVDWQLLVLFIGLFVVNDALAVSGLLADGRARLEQAGVRLEHPGWLFVVTVLLSNLVSNVPAVMLLLPAAEHPLAGPTLALASTLAGNLFIVGSIANIIVVEQARRCGVRITWSTHARIGVPLTALTLALAGAWLWVRSLGG